MMQDSNMPHDDSPIEPTVDPTELEDRGIETESFSAESADFDAAVEASPSVVEARDEVTGDVAALASTPTGGSDNPVLREYERDVHDTIVELRRIESDIRDMIQDRDPVRKRKFTGTSRWQELEDDLINWRFTGRFDENILRRVQELIGRRHYLFRHLGYLSSTRPVWNS